MSKKHVYLGYDFTDKEGMWVRTSSHIENRVEYQLHSKSSQVYDGMLARCKVDGDYQRKFPTYIGTINNFMDFQEFTEWCRSQEGYFQNYNGKNWSLDKDVIVKGNLLYSINTCCFLPEFLNTMFSNKTKNTKYNLPIGVSPHGNKFRSRCSTSLGRVHLGLFTTPEKAHAAWQLTKAEHIKTVTEIYSKMQGSREDVVQSLYGRASDILSDYRNCIQTTSI